MKRLEFCGDFRIQLSAAETYDMLRLRSDRKSHFFKTKVGSQLKKLFRETKEQLNWSDSLGKISLDVVNLEVVYASERDVVELHWDFEAGVLTEEIKQSSIETMLRDWLIQVCYQYRQQNEREIKPTVNQWKLCD